MDDRGAIQWRLFGVIPMMMASGPDITRSGEGRVQAEPVWLPSVLTGEDVSWSTPDPAHAQAALTAHGTVTELCLTIGGAGRLGSVHMSRWGNPEGWAYHAVDFGGVAEQEGTFYGYTIPTRMRVGWYPGTERFESEGEFFRVTIDDALYR